VPVRASLPRDDVRLDLLEPSSARTECAYEGVASYLARGGTDLAWSYEAPLPDAGELTGLVCFFDEKVDVTLDGEKRPRRRVSTQASGQRAGSGAVAARGHTCTSSPGCRPDSSSSHGGGVVG
jgi:nucleotidyltransferase-like protein